MLDIEANVTDLDFTMTTNLGTVTGFVTNGTVPVTDAEVHLRNDENEYVAYSTIPLGRYDIVDVEPGTYVAFASMDGYQTNYSELPVVVTGGQEIMLDFNLTEEPATIFGRVVYGNNGVSDVRVDIESGPYTRTVYTDSMGNYSIVGIPMGEYQVGFSKDGYISQQFEVTLDPQVPRVLDVTLEKEADPGGGFIPGFDLPHSLMVLGLACALITMVFAIVVRFRLEKRPDLLEREEEEEEKED
jgi:hypothetical protein